MVGISIGTGAFENQYALQAVTKTGAYWLARLCACMPDKRAAR